MENFQKLVEVVETSKADAEKFFGEKANAQAGKRLRSSLQEVALLAKTLRKEISAVKTERKAKV